jgi:tetratricopeptide (TPR) repeat protein
MLERIIFNILSFSLFIIIFFKIIKKNDTTYVVPLILEAIGIAIGLIEILIGRFLGTFIRVITYLLAIVLPLAIILIEKYGLNFSELLYIFLARLCNIFNNNKKAKQLLMNLINKYPESYNGHRLLAQNYEKEGGMRKAIDEYVKAIDINKKDYDSYYKISELLVNLGKKDEAIQMLTNLIHNKPDYYNASKLLGGLLCEQENFKEAINVYMNALKYNDKESFEIYYNLGIAYTRLNDFQNAKSCYEKAAKINALNYKGYYNLGLISMLYDDLDEAEKYFIEGIKVEDTEPESCYQLARIYIIKGEKERAINYLDRAINLDSSFAEKAAKDQVFLSIERYIPKNINKIVRKKVTMTKPELLVKKHLEDTYLLVGKISKNELKNMNTVKGKSIDIQKDERENL